MQNKDIKFSHHSAEEWTRKAFIDLDIRHLPPAVYLVRKSILKAVREVSHIATGTVVDLACGEMPYRREFTKSDSLNYIGIDLDNNQYHNTIKPNLFWDGKTIPLNDNSVDFMLATEFLEHYFDTQHILGEIRRVLKPGGNLFITVPQIWPIHEPPWDYHRFTPFNLQEAFRIANFQKSKVSALGGHNYQFAIAIALWHEQQLGHRLKKITFPILKAILTALTSKDTLPKEFLNHTIFSGLSALATK